MKLKNVVLNPNEEYDDECSFEVVGKAEIDKDGVARVVIRTLPLLEHEKKLRAAYEWRESLRSFVEGAEKNKEDRVSIKLLHSLL